MSEEPSIPPAEAALLLGIPEEEARSLAGPDGGVPPEALLRRTGAAVLELARELARAREEAGGLAGQLKEVRATNLRLRDELKAGVGERRRLTDEVLELRAAAEERLMLMERIERIAGIEAELEEAEAELHRLRSRGILARLLDR
ncbi:hypothetical protein GBA65_03475 [Rubrobacter marinus]|uniref:Uncharacterized protein n=1 Tax=Rubrobacter marinus TaxID=2653852 RepID=A0A6G8PTB1_9ACTN|nr:hypothetical protein [Rubrobacter marinus]QIN77729.1 hypothetical protein GBA65_03475 [Rubrobacter marinus]